MEVYYTNSLGEEFKYGEEGVLAFYSSMGNEITLYDFPANKQTESNGHFKPDMGEKNTYIITELMKNRAGAYIRLTELINLKKKNECRRD